jgi:hypothetical protein
MMPGNPSPMLGQRRNLFRPLLPFRSAYIAQWRSNLFVAGRTRDQSPLYAPVLTIHPCSSVIEQVPTKFQAPSSSLGRGSISFYKSFRPDSAISANMSQINDRCIAYPPSGHQLGAVVGYEPGVQFVVNTLHSFKMTCKRSEENRHYSGKPLL